MADDNVRWADTSSALAFEAPRVSTLDVFP
jgi:hypothetical protein